MNATPLISIVIPNYNSGLVLERAITSLLNQSYRNYQLIVADSVSTDESAAILERYAKYVNVLLREKDTCQANGLNRGFEHAAGDVYGWLCADDELLPDALATVVDLFQQNPASDVVIGGCERIYQNGERHITVPPTDALERAGAIDLIEQPSCFWRAQLHRRCGPLDESFHLAFDWDFWCRMHRAGARAIATEAVLSRYYFSETNKTSNSGEQFVAEASRILREYGPRNGRLAAAYRTLFRHFDLHGCYDNPPTANPARMLAFRVARRALGMQLGADLISSYNWHFASLQVRGKKWW